MKYKYIHNACTQKCNTQIKYTPTHIYIYTYTYITHNCVLIANSKCDIGILWLRKQLHEIWLETAQNSQPNCMQILIIHFIVPLHKTSKSSAFLIHFFIRKHTRTREQTSSHFIFSIFLLRIRELQPENQPTKVKNFPLHVPSNLH